MAQPAAGSSPAVGCLRCWTLFFRKQKPARQRKANVILREAQNDTVDGIKDCNLKKHFLQWRLLYIY